jgi:hypothetical protein
MKPNKRPNCNCTNCDRSCYRSDSGVRLNRTSKEQAKKRLSELKEMVAGGAQ